MGGALEQACQETGGNKSAGKQERARPASCSQAKYRTRAAMARFLPAASGFRRAICGKPSGFLGIFKKRRKILHLALTSGEGCGILNMRLAMTNLSADTERRRTWERRPLRGTTGGAGRKRSFFPSRRPRGRGRGPVWLTPVMIGISPLSFPLISCFPHERPRTDAIPSGAKRRPFPVVRSGSGRRFFKSTCAVPGGFV